MFQLLMQNSLYVKLNKCKFAKSSIEYLGHLMTKEWIAIVTKNIRAILEWLVPTTICERVFEIIWLSHEVY